MSDSRRSDLKGQQIGTIEAAQAALGKSIVEARRLIEQAENLLNQVQPRTSRAKRYDG